MSSPMEVTLQSATSETAVEVCKQTEVVLESSISPIHPAMFADDKVLISVEVCLKPSSTARADDVRKAVERMLEKRSLSYVDGPVPVPPDDSFLLENVKRILICDTDEWVDNHKVLLFWQVRPVVHVFQLSEDGPVEELSGGDMLSSFNEWNLLAKEFDGMWESLMYETGVKQRLLRYTASALLFTEKDVAFVGRADTKAYVGPPTLQARYEILRSCIQELVHAGILVCSQDHGQILLPNYSTLKEKLHSSQTAEHQGSLHLSKLLLEAAEACQVKRESTEKASIPNSCCFQQSLQL